MIGDKNKDLSRELKEIRENKKLRNDAVAQRQYLESKEFVLSHKDIDHRFEDYNNDISIGQMFQRKKRKNNIKSKRAHVLCKTITFFIT